MNNKKPESVELNQSEKFKAMAKELEADGDEKSLDKTLKQLAKTNTSKPKS